MGQFDGLGLEDGVLVLALEAKIAGLSLANCLWLLLLDRLVLVLRLLLVNNGRESHLGLGIRTLFLNKDNALNKRASDDSRSTTLENGQEKRVSSRNDLRAQVDLCGAETSGDIATEEDGLFLFVVKEGDIHG